MIKNSPIKSLDSVYSTRDQGWILIRLEHEKFSIPFLKKYIEEPDLCHTKPLLKKVIKKQLMNRLRMLKN